MDKKSLLFFDLGLDLINALDNVLDLRLHPQAAYSINVIPCFARLTCPIS